MISDYLWGSEKTWIARHNGLLLFIVLTSILGWVAYHAIIFKQDYAYRAAHDIPFADCVENNGTNVMLVRFSTVMFNLDCIATTDYYVHHGWNVQRYGISGNDWIVLEKK